MALNLNVGGDDNEYIGMAEKARGGKGGSADGGGLKTLLQGIGAAIGISKPVAKEPKKAESGKPSETGDLASPNPTETQLVRDDKGDVISAMEVAAQPALAVSPLPMVGVTPAPRRLIEVDPDTGLPLIKLPGARANNNFGPVPSPRY